MSDCEAQVWLGATRLTCDREANHDGPHGGSYPGESHGGTYAQTIDVSVQWKEPT